MLPEEKIARLNGTVQLMDVAYKKQQTEYKAMLDSTLKQIEIIQEFQLEIKALRAENELLKVRLQSPLKEFFCNLIGKKPLALK